MSEEQNKINVYESNRFTKTLKKCSMAQLKIIEDEIDFIIQNPEIGVLKKGNLSHLRVHKFKINHQQVLLGYSWIEEKIELYLLHLGSHENFYQKTKDRRNVDLKFMQP